MSRSYKKTPRGGVCVHSAGSMKKWKKQATRTARRRIAQMEELPQNNDYRMITDTWTSPCDGKTWFGDYIKDGGSKWRQIMGK